MKSFASWYHLEIVTEDRTKSGCLLTNPGWHYDWFGLYFWPFRSYVFIVLHVSGLKKIRIFYERCEHLGEPLVFSRQNLISIHSCSSNGDRSTKYLQKSFPFMHFFSNFATWRGSKQSSDSAEDRSWQRLSRPGTNQKSFLLPCQWKPPALWIHVYRPTKLRQWSKTAEIRPSGNTCRPVKIAFKVFHFI